MVGSKKYFSFNSFAVGNAYMSHKLPILRPFTFYFASKKIMFNVSKNTKGLYRQFATTLWQSKHFLMQLVKMKKVEMKLLLKA